MSSDSAPRRLQPREVARLLNSLGAAMVAELLALPDEVAAWHPAPGEWCVKECLGHILEAERRGFNGRIRTMLKEHDPKLPGWDQQAVARERQDCAKNPRDLASEFQAMRADSIALVEHLTEQDEERSGTHEKVGYLQVKDLLQEWVHHDRNHFRQVQANIQAYVWPSMANTQKFAGE
jgi:hypothetical protein